MPVRGTIYGFIRVERCPQARLNAGFFVSVVSNNVQQNALIVTRKTGYPDG